MKKTWVLYVKAEDSGYSRFSSEGYATLEEAETAAKEATVKHKIPVLIFEAVAVVRTELPPTTVTRL